MSGSGCSWLVYLLKVILHALPVTEMVGAMIWLPPSAVITTLGAPAEEEDGVLLSVNGRMQQRYSEH